jgi:hypothetical protein
LIEALFIECSPHECKELSLCFAVSKRIDLPRAMGTTALSKMLSQPLKS